MTAPRVNEPSLPFIILRILLWLPVLAVAYYLGRIGEYFTRGKANG